MISGKVLHESWEYSLTVSSNLSTAAQSRNRNPSQRHGPCQDTTGWRLLGCGVGVECVSNGGMFHELQTLVVVVVVVLVMVVVMVVVVMVLVVLVLVVLVMMLVMVLVVLVMVESGLCVNIDKFHAFIFKC